MNYLSNKLPDHNTISSDEILSNKEEVFTVGQVYKLELHDETTSSNKVLLDDKISSDIDYNNSSPNYDIILNDTYEEAKTRLAQFKGTDNWMRQRWNFYGTTFQTNWISEENVGEPKHDIVPKYLARNVFQSSMKRQPIGGPGSSNPIYGRMSYAIKQSAQQSEPIIQSECIKCGTKAGLICSRCRKTYYCGKICQTTDWPTHKLNCHH